jgi:hypothetical protein
MDKVMPEPACVTADPHRVSDQLIIKARTKRSGEGDGGAEGLCAPVVVCGNAAPHLGAAEHDLDPVGAAITLFVVTDGFAAQLLAPDERAYPFFVNAFRNQSDSQPRSAISYLVAGKLPRSAAAPV